MRSRVPPDPLMKKNLFCSLYALLLAPVWGAGATQAPFKTYYCDSPDHSRALGNGAVVVTTDSGNAYLRKETAHHAYVSLAGTGQPYIAFTAAAAANSIVVRYSLPYTPGENHAATFTLGLYINNVLQPTRLKCSLKYIHADEGGNASFWPASSATPLAQVQRWWEETTLLLTGTTIQTGDRIKLQKTTGDNASAYYLDTVDLEQVVAPLTKPAGAVSIVTHGAIAGPNADTAANKTAVINAINAAKTGSKIVWIPQGAFYVDPMIALDGTMAGITIQGAGMWYSTLVNAMEDFSGTSHLFTVGAGADDIKVTQLHLDFAASARRSQDGTRNGGHHFFGAGGNGLWLEKIWFTHGATPAWYNGNDGVFQFNRVRCTYADSFHLQDTASRNLIHQNHSRGIGDDGIVQWSNAGSQGFNNQFTFNTVEAQYQGRGIAFFGGQGNIIDSNLITGGNITYGILLRPEVKGNASARIYACTLTNNVIDRAGVTSTVSLKADDATIDADLNDNVFTNLPSGGIVISGTKQITGQVMRNDIGHPVITNPPSPPPPSPYPWIVTSGATNAGGLVISNNILRP